MDDIFLGSGDLYGSQRQGYASDGDWFSVQGDLDDFIFYDPLGCDWPCGSDL